ncbi:MAG: hypothetical protein KF726_16795 [Anaerolineae bacterium]|nr:hypothetical protein [Anaerolineae bacterium]
MGHLILTAFDIKSYLNEALPAMKAAIFRGNLSPAKDVLAIRNEALLGEWDLNDALANEDYSWLFTERSAQVEDHDPDGLIVGLTYPLILAYHQPDLLRLPLESAELNPALPFPADFSTGIPGLPGTEGIVQAGFQEGLRAMWEIVGYVSPEDTRALHTQCLTLAEQTPTRAAWTRDAMKLTEGLNEVLRRGYGLVVERE